ncbi:hypothetical protein K501DRAFT_275297 [Backusella circina FSU 941]|nr:hypothetical protein K501DRAFT_275297 [Backusella circina FSU 941]
MANPSSKILEMEIHARMAFFPKSILWKWESILKNGNPFPLLQIKVERILLGNAGLKDRGWLSGIIFACHAKGPGSIPGPRTVLQLLLGLVFCLKGFLFKTREIMLGSSGSKLIQYTGKKRSFDISKTGVLVHQNSAIILVPIQMF